VSCRRVYDEGFDWLLDLAIRNKPAARRLVIATGISLGTGLVGLVRMLLR
jgi:hypothetical protein